MPGALTVSIVVAVLINALISILGGLPRAEASRRRRWHIAAACTGSGIGFLAMAGCFFFFPLTQGGIREIVFPMVLLYAAGMPFFVSIPAATVACSFGCYFYSRTCARKWEGEHDFQDTHKSQLLGIVLMSAPNIFWVLVALTGEYRGP